MDLEKQLHDILKVYEADVSDGLESALDTCCDIYIAELERIAPRGRGTGDGEPYHKSFVVKKGRRARYVGNKKTVSGGERKDIPLINLLEFGRGDGDKRVGRRPHMNEAMRATVDAMVDAVIKKMEGT